MTHQPTTLLTESAPEAHDAVGPPPSRGRADGVHHDLRGAPGPGRTVRRARRPGHAPAAATMSA